MEAVEHGFKAEVQQLLRLMIHSVYSDREVFLRELVSNAADALDKVRFLGLTRSDLVAAAHETEAIRISFDADANTITIDDDGVGMTEEEIVQNLGTIAHSGTKAFLEKAAAADGAPQLIGQFGLGFYSAFMVADEVVVESRSADPDAEAVRWTSHGEGTYTLEPSTREARGTAITLHLREDASEFGEVGRLRSVIRKHSNFLAWPIEIDGEQANSAKALWVEPASSVTDEEANAFYKTIATDWQDPARRIHVSVDSPMQYHAMLFVPQTRPFDLFYQDGTKGPRLYARRVLIEEHARDLLPDWLRFVRGVVDSEDIPLNVSREMVQKTAVVRKISDALTKRVLKDLGRWAAEDPEAAPVVETEDEDAETPLEPPTYDQFWRNFGMLLKEGYYHGKSSYGEQLLPLLRFNAVSHDDGEGLVSLADYKAAMPEDQDTIWFLSADSRTSALASPHLEAFAKRGWDVLLLTDPVDEWLVSVLDEFDDTPLKSVARGELDLEDDEDDAEKADLTEFAPWMAELLTEQVSEVRASTRLTDSAVVLVDAEDGMSSNMERLLRESQQGFGGMATKRVLEINPKHVLIRNLVELRNGGKEDDAAELARMLYDDALLLEGSVTEPAAMGRRLQDLLVRASRAALG